MKIQNCQEHPILLSSQQPTVKHIAKTRAKQIAKPTAKHIAKSTAKQIAKPTAKHIATSKHVVKATSKLTQRYSQTQI